MTRLRLFQVLFLLLYLSFAKPFAASGQIDPLPVRNDTAVHIPNDNAKQMLEQLVNSKP
ncbi:hypothetical protein SAMN05216464_10829 [Mucilaginibacter pineti]|uniref:Uncharacterized protein n=1 Tax=Mucilaginibacter pineti TaxID=1391627 RepID=A0A1G7EHI8_9SPHI|nr:hypothetical protein [Mucilaginibacter pineti]SDE63144.1 hypothetical protein SAMN05216464_10829 [Mucilaginibacter pineti]